MMPDDELTARIRRAYRQPDQLPRPTDEWATQLKAAILDDDAVHIAAAQPPSGRPHAQLRRVPAVAIGLGSLVIAATAIAGVAIVRDSGSPQPLGPDTPVSLLERLDASSTQTMPDDLAAYARDRMDLNRTQLVADIDGMQAYVGPALNDPDGICVFAARREADGPYSTYGCGPAPTATGLVATELPTRTGGADVPRVRFGIVPDDVVSVAPARGGTAVPVRDNVFALPLAHAGAAPVLRFTRTDGSTVDIKVASPTE